MEKKKKKRKARWFETVCRVFESPTAKLGGIMFVVILVLCVGAPLFARYDETALDMANTLATPSAAHWCGILWHSVSSVPCLRQSEAPAWA
jgi:ABC-type dipeptide/oligopeptide/nickel transport system permease subunit